MSPIPRLPSWEFESDSLASAGIWPIIPGVTPRRSMAATDLFVRRFSLPIRASRSCGCFLSANLERIANVLRIVSSGMADLQGQRSVPSTNKRRRFKWTSEAKPDLGAAPPSTTTRHAAESPTGAFKQATNMRRLQLGSTGDSRCWNGVGAIGRLRREPSSIGNARLVRTASRSISAFESRNDGRLN